MHSRTTLLLALLVVVAAQVAVLFAFHNPVLDGQLNGADSYMRLNRVLQLFETGNWYNPFETRTNAPYGELLHWTRPLDTLLYAGAWLGSAVTDFRHALFVWGMLIGPALLLAAVPVWSWGTRPLLGPIPFVLTFALFPLFTLLNGTFRPGNPDHHGLIALCFLSLVAILVRLASGHAGVRAAIAAGAIAGLAVWIGIVEVMAMAYAGTALGLLWLWRGAPYDRFLSAYVGGLVAMITLALAIERPPGDWLTPFYERLSIVHWFVAAAVAVAWVIARTAAGRIADVARPPVRLAALAAAGAMALAAIDLTFPGFFAAPLADGGTPQITRWLDDNIEFLPLWPHDWAGLQQFLTMLGPALVALVAMAWRWRTAEDTLRNVFFVLAVGYAFYLPLALDAIRWGSFVQALALLPLMSALVALWRWDGAFTIGATRVRLRSTAAVSLLFGPLFAAAVVAGVAGMPRVTNPATAPHTLAAAAQVLRRQHCSVPAISAYLRGIYSPDDGVLFSYLNWGSELVWRTPYSVVGAPYTNPVALADTGAIFQATDDAKAAAVVRRRGIGLILVCVDSFERYPDRSGVNLHNRLVAGTPPPWLLRVALPAALAKTFRLYRVDRAALPR